MTLMRLLGLNNLKSFRGGRRRSRTRKRRKSRRRQRGGDGALHQRTGHVCWLAVDYSYL